MSGYGVVFLGVGTEPPNSATQRALIEKRAADTIQGRRLHAAAEVLTGISFVPEERIPKVLDNPFRATTFFAMSLKTLKTF